MSRAWKVGFMSTRLAHPADRNTSVRLSGPAFRQARRRSHSAMHRDFNVVAIPAKDEAERIASCLIALARQTYRPHAVPLLADNCRDGTPAIAAAMAPTLHYRLHVECHDFAIPNANAGQARRLAMTLAERLLRPDGILMTTDADTVVAPDWIERNGKAIAAGADLVCGRTILSSSEAALIPAHLHADDTLECRLLLLLDRNHRRTAAHGSRVLRRPILGAIRSHAHSHGMAGRPLRSHRAVGGAVFPAPQDIATVTARARGARS
jgi:hypothetical protein